MCAFKIDMLQVYGLLIPKTSSKPILHYGKRLNQLPDLQYQLM